MTRLPAEWEAQSFIQYTFPHRNSDWAYMYDEVVVCFVRIIEATARFEPVLVVCHDEREVSAHFANRTKFPIHFQTIEANDTWARDHAAITVLDGDKPTLLDFTFNGWGQKFEASLDNQITRNLGTNRFSSLTIQTEDFVLEGGAIESDGQGTLLTTTECLLSPYRNPKMSQSEIETYLKKTFGLQKVLWLDHGYLAGDDTDSHIDTLARLCTPNIIAYVKCDDPTDEHYVALQQMEAQLKTFSNAAGETYQLVALPWPDACFDADGNRLPATYANFLIVNGAVLVPTYDVAQDQNALDIIQGIFPDREIVGLDCRPLIDQHGSLHCISMQFPVQVEMNQR
ncbi:agmatine deiminase family protein [Reichenbachiella agarivorans]|uniref:Agmatine deiminase family protein n=1 Tax=Reichenbachiella agarivorans TaxID=2979464 RepID=A0ABY6CS92_9BACT|nr:agmatine deiminase family protein [Reichenbachiella agarivorans]UXP33377.1 agmatine deiminase family protein [Reichenbachiella agarivorans]